MNATAASLQPSRDTRALVPAGAIAPGQNHGERPAGDKESPERGAEPRPVSPFADVRPTRRSIVHIGDQRHRARRSYRSFLGARPPRTSKAIMRSSPVPGLAPRFFHAVSSRAAPSTRRHPTASKTSSRQLGSIGGWSRGVARRLERDEIRRLERVLLPPANTELVVVLTGPIPNDALPLEEFGAACSELLRPMQGRTDEHTERERRRARGRQSRENSTKPGGLVRLARLEKGLGGQFVSSAHHTSITSKIGVRGSRPTVARLSAS